MRACDFYFYLFYKVKLIFETGKILLIEADRKIGYQHILIIIKDKMDLLRRKTINCSAKYIKFDEMKNQIFLDALSKIDARWDRKQVH